MSGFLRAVDEELCAGSCGGSEGVGRDVFRTAGFYVTGCWQIEVTSFR